MIFSSKVKSGFLSCPRYVNDVVCRVCDTYDVTLYWYVHAFALEKSQNDSCLLYWGRFIILIFHFGWEIIATHNIHREMFYFFFRSLMFSPIRTKGDIDLACHL